MAGFYLCILPGQRPGNAKGGERARPVRVLVFFGHFDVHIQGPDNFLSLRTRVLQGRSVGGYYVF